MQTCSDRGCSKRDKSYSRPFFRAVFCPPEKEGLSLLTRQLCVVFLYWTIGELQRSAGMCEDAPAVPVVGSLSTVSRQASHNPKAISPWLRISHKADTNQPSIQPKPAQIP